MTNENLCSVEIEIKNRLKDNICDEYYFLLGSIEEKKNNLKKAIEYYKKAAEIFPLKTYFIRMGLLYEKLGNNDEKQLAFDMASVTFGNIWTFGNYKSSFMKTNFQRYKVTPEVLSALDYSRKKRISDILSYVVERNIKKAFEKYDKDMKFHLRFNYDYDRLIKIFAPYPEYYNRLLKKLDANYFETYWNYRFYNELYKTKKIQRAFEGKYKLTSEETKICFYYYRLLKFVEKLIMANLTSYKNAWNEWKDFGFTFWDLDKIKYLEKILYDKYDYLAIKRQDNINIFIWNKYFYNRLPDKYAKKRYNKYEIPEKWLNKLIDSLSIK